MNLKRFFYIFLIFTLFISCPKKKDKKGSDEEKIKSGPIPMVVSDNLVKEEETSFSQNEIEETKVAEPSYSSLAEQIENEKKQKKKKKDKKIKEHFQDNEEGGKIIERESQKALSFITPSGKKIKQKRVGDIRYKREADPLSFKRSKGANYPHDFRIGSLANLRTTDFVEKEVISTIKNFFRIFADNKKIEEKYLFPKSKDVNINNMKYYLDSGALPDSVFRIGQINHINNIVRVNVRFYYDESCTDGEVILEEFVDEKGYKKWLISDIQVDFMKLLTEYKGYKEPYSPSSYSYFDWE